MILCGIMLQPVATTNKQVDQELPVVLCRIMPEDIQSCRMDELGK